MKTRHFSQLVLLSALWGASFLFIRVSSPVFGPNALAFIRVALATATLALVMRWMGQRWPWRHWRELLGLGALTVVVPFVLYAWALIRLPAGYGALLNTTAVVFGTLSSAWFKEDRLTRSKLLGCLAGFAGVGLIVQLGPLLPTPETLLATGACVLAAASFGVATPLMKRATTRMEPLAISASIHLASVLLIAPLGVAALPQARFTWGAAAAVTVLGVVTSGLAYWVHLRIVRHISPVASMMPIFMIPVFGVTWGHLFLGEALSPGIFVGGALVLLACALVTGFNPLRRPAAPDAPP